MIRPLSEVLTVLGLQIMTHAQIALLSSEKPVPECLIYNALPLMSQLKVKIAFICMFSFISSKLLWKQRYKLLFFWDKKMHIWGDELTCQRHSSNNLWVKAWSQVFGLLHQCFPVSPGFSPGRSSGHSWFCSVRVSVLIFTKTESVPSWLKTTKYLLSCSFA